MQASASGSGGVVAWVVKNFSAGLVLLCLALVAIGMALSAGRGEAASGLTVTLLAQGGVAFTYPLDATPDPTGAAVYFVARTASGEAGVFRVPTAGGPVQNVLVGAPLVAPRGIVMSTDGQTLYVADPEAGGGGAVFALAATGGPANVVAGMGGTRPRALDLVREGQGDVLYVAGVDPRNRRADVWRLTPIGAGSRTSILRGSPLAVIDGVAVASSGEVFVAGRSGNSDRTDVVLRLASGRHHRLVRTVNLGNPAGIALTPDESTLLVSSLAADGTSQVLIVDLASGGLSTFNDVIGANRGSGGLHRSHQANYYAWAGIGRQGGVYGVGP